MRNVIACCHNVHACAPNMYEVQIIIGASLSEPHIDWHNGPRGGKCIYQSVTG